MFSAHRRLRWQWRAWLALAFVAQLYGPAAALSRAESSAASSGSGDPDHCHCSRYAFTLEPRLFFVNRDHYAEAFHEVGFDSPSKTRPGLSALAYWITPDDWHLGFGITGAYVTHDDGMTEATFHDDYYGLYGAKNLTPGHALDVSLGGMVAGGGAMIETFSPALNGKYTELSLVLEPTLSVDYRISGALKLGLAASYVFPITIASKIAGIDLGVRDISLEGFSLGARLTIGQFG